MSDFSTGLQCKVCGKLYAKQALNFCTDDFGPLEVMYDYDAIRKNVSDHDRYSPVSRDFSANPFGVR